MNNLDMKPTAYNAIELAICTIQEQLPEEKHDEVQEYIWGLFGLTINGLTEEHEDEILEAISQIEDE